MKIVYITQQQFANGKVVKKELVLMDTFIEKLHYEYHITVI